MVLSDFILFFLPPPWFPDDNFRTAWRIVPKFSPVMVKGRSVSFSDPARPPGGEWGAPKHPKISPSKISNFVIFFCVLGPQEHFLEKNNFVVEPPYLRISGAFFFK